VRAQDALCWFLAWQKLGGGNNKWQSNAAALANGCPVTPAEQFPKEYDANTRNDMVCLLVRTAAPKRKTEVVPQRNSTRKCKVCIAPSAWTSREFGIPSFFEEYFHLGSFC